ncbi:MAG: 4Fe-4S binding protein [Defluviitaleaceae bacterium]|nr:4Fe-4S binding protein [Defluviitaleaceae bacterium]
MNSNKIFTNDNCVGCNLCISVCPCNEANVAQVKDGTRKVFVDESKCINCGQCLRVCTHDARDYTDDTARFISDISAGKDISLIVAPALRSNVQSWQRLLGHLKSLGVNMVYDTSFGADICTWAYLRYISVSSAKGLISQPCPAIVSYIERYVPELLSRLAPIHSPAMCTAVYMKKYMAIPGDYAFLSPCIAKSDEFNDPNTGSLIKYNITFKKLLEHLEENGEDYHKSPPAEYDNPPHGLGAVYPSPGGLYANVRQHVKDAWVFKIEGQPRVSSFLHEYVNTRSDSPLLVDILSCAGGCNTGPGACLTEDMELTAGKAMHKVSQEAANSESKPDFTQFDKELKLEDYCRQYTPRKIMPIFVDRHQMEDAFNALHKSSHEHRVTDCKYCGYSTCQEMAVAIAKGINHVDNCVDYLRSSLKTTKEVVL